MRNLVVVMSVAVACAAMPVHAKEKGIEELKLCAMVTDLAYKVALARDQGVSQKRIDKEIDDNSSVKRPSVRQLLHATVSAVYRNRDASPVALKEELGLQCIMNI